MSADDPINPKAQLSPAFAGLCCREHLPGTLCILPDGHSHDDRRDRHHDAYEDIEQVNIPLDRQDPVVVGGFAVRAAVVPLPASEETGVERHFPTLIFDFTLDRGHKLQPIALVMDETDLERVGRLIGNAAHGAIGAARTAEGRDPKTGRRTS